MAIYITVTGTGFRYGTDFVKKKMVFTLEKEPDNKYDKEAIKVILPGVGEIGYVANSAKTVIGECYSAGRLYDKMGETCQAKFKYNLNGSIVCKVKKKSLLEKESKPVKADKQKKQENDLEVIYDRNTDTDKPLPF